MSEKPILYLSNENPNAPNTAPGDSRQPNMQAYPSPPNYQNAGFASQGGYPTNPAYPPDQRYTSTDGPSGSVPPTGFAPGYQYVPKSLNNPSANRSNPPYGVIDPELGGEPEIKGFDFSEASIRRGFIRKVYSILTIQLSITLIFIFWFGYHDATQHWVATNIALAYVNIAVSFALIIAFVCVEAARRKTPLNFILLFIFTVAESYLVALTTIRYDPEDVLIAIGLTTIVCVSLTIFAFQTKWDFTILGGSLFVAVILLIIFGIFAALFPSKTMILLYSVCGCIIFSIYLIYDTQMIIGGEHKFKVSPEEYILGTIALYLDILNLFLHILRIVAAARKN